MKKIILGLAVILILYLSSYLFLGGFFLGYQNGHAVIYKYTCADICPQYGYWGRKFAGEISENECLQIGGKSEYVTYAGVAEHAYNGCSPK